MSIYKQMEDSRLTLDEIQELITLLKDVLPKVKQKLDSKTRAYILAKNLRENLMKDGSLSISADAVDSPDDLEKGYNLLESANLKLSKFKESIIEC